MQSNAVDYYSVPFLDRSSVLCHLEASRRAAFPPNKRVSYGKPNVLTKVSVT